MTKQIHLLCPYCQSQARIVKARCDSCEINIEGNFAPNEFAHLGAEDLHFLRIFLQFEGRIKDMESPLGLSYPTIRTRITQLKERLFTSPMKLDSEAESKGLSLDSPLTKFEKGEINYEEMLKQIKNKKREKK